MSLTISQLCDNLIMEDEVTVLELLDITSCSLVNLFKHKVIQRKEYLQKYYENEPHQKEASFKRPTEAAGLSSKEVWSEAGFDIDEEGWR